MVIYKATTLFHSTIEPTISIVIYSQYNCNGIANTTPRTITPTWNIIFHKNAFSLIFSAYPQIQSQTCIQAKNVAKNLAKWGAKVPTSALDIKSLLIQHSFIGQPQYYNTFLCDATLFFINRLQNYIILISKTKWALHHHILNKVRYFALWTSFHQCQENYTWYAYLLYHISHIPS